MRLLDKMRKAFNAGGIRIALEAPGQFAWEDPVIPVRVTLTGHEADRRSVPHLDFRLRDIGDGGGPPGTRPAPDRRRPDGRIVDHAWRHQLSLHLAPGETRTVTLQVPLTGHGGPGMLDRATVTGTGLQFTVGAQWFELSVSASVDGAPAARSDSARLQAAR